MTKTDISLNDIYAVMNRLEDKMDVRLKDIEGRVDTLEDFRGKMFGIGSIIAIGASAIFSWIWEKVTRQ